MLNVILEFKDQLKNCHEIKLTRDDRNTLLELLVRHQECIENGSVVVSVTGDDELISINCDECNVIIMDSNRIKIRHGIINNNNDNNNDNIQIQPEN